MVKRVYLWHICYHIIITLRSQTTCTSSTSSVFVAPFGHSYLCLKILSKSAYAWAEKAGLLWRSVLYCEFRSPLYTAWPLPRTAWNRACWRNAIFLQKKKTKWMHLPRFPPVSQDSHKGTAILLCQLTVRFDNGSLLLGGKSWKALTARAFFCWTS